MNIGVEYRVILPPGVVFSYYTNYAYLCKWMLGHNKTQFFQPLQVLTRTYTNRWLSFYTQERIEF